jgi:hypothetical protein
MSTARSDLRANLFSTVDDWREAWNAAPTTERHEIHQGYAARPASFHPPLFYIGGISETLNHSAGVRQRLQTAQVAIVRGLYDNAEAMEWLDDACDSLLDYLSDRPHAISNTTVITPLSTEDVELDLGGGTIYAATLISLRHDYADGRG